MYELFFKKGAAHYQNIHWLSGGLFFGGVFSALVFLLSAVGRLLVRRP
jgi:hypothetical protein